jgi:hypothetical protein
VNLSPSFARRTGTKYLIDEAGISQAPKSATKCQESNSGERTATTSMCFVNFDSDADLPGSSNSAVILLALGMKQAG